MTLNGPYYAKNNLLELQDKNDEVKEEVEEGSELTQQ